MLYANSSDERHQLPRSGDTLFITPDGRTVDNTREIEILVENIPHLHSTPSLEGSPWEYWHNVWCGKTRITWIPDDAKKSTI